MTLRHSEWQRGQAGKAALAAAYLRPECGTTFPKQSPNQSILVDSHPPGP